MSRPSATLGATPLSMSFEKLRNLLAAFRLRLSRGRRWLGRLFAPAKPKSCRRSFRQCPPTLRRQPPRWPRLRVCADGRTCGIDTLPTAGKPALSRRADSAGCRPRGRWPSRSAGCDPSPAPSSRSSRVRLGPARLVSLAPSRDWRRWWAALPPCSAACWAWAALPRE